MFILKGKIFDIHNITDKDVQIVVRKKIGEKIVPVAISMFGFYWEKAKAMGLKQGDKITGKVYLKSKFWEKGTKYFTDAYFKEIKVLERGNTIQFISDQKRTIVNTETGEIIENK